MSNHYDLIIIGAGAAGMFAAISAAKKIGSDSRSRILLIEKSNKPGVKILISGGTRCNITHATDESGIAEAFGNQGRFLRSALAAMPPQQVIRLVESRGVATKREDTGKIFPISNRAIDVRDAFWELVKQGCTTRLGEAVISIDRVSDQFQIMTNAAKANVVTANQLIIACGGQSYPGCGTTGDGYAWARQFGHTIVKTVPSLTPIKSSETWVHELSGLTCPRVGVSVIGEKEKPAKRNQTTFDTLRQKQLSKSPDSLLFTHFGFSGPAILNPSRFVAYSNHQTELELSLDFEPDQSLEQLAESFVSKKQTDRNRSVDFLLNRNIQKRLAEKIVALSNLSAHQKLPEVSNKELRRLAETIKRVRIPISGTLGFKKAEVTAGGVSLDEVNSKTMESKKQEKLFIVGELLDLDGPIGGYNFQAAFSTGWLAGMQYANES